jgi:hypothetical protein
MTHKVSGRERRLQIENAELRQRNDLLIQRSDEVLSSRAWRLGRVLAKLERPFRKLLLGDRRPYRHLRREYFHSLAAPPPVLPLTGRFDDIPPHYDHMNVADAMEELWAATAPSRSA